MEDRAIVLFQAWGKGAKSLTQEEMERGMQEDESSFQHLRSRGFEWKDLWNEYADGDGISEADFVRFYQKLLPDTQES